MDDPPNDTNGNGTPVTGQQPDHGADVDQCLDDDPRRDAGGEEGAEAVRRPDRGPDAEEGEGDEQPDTIMQPMRPTSSPITAKMKSVWALGR